MKVLLFLILSQTVFADPLCEPSATQAKSSIHDKMSPLVQLAQSQSDGGMDDDNDSRAYAKEVNCIMSLAYAYNPFMYGTEFIGKKPIAYGSMRVSLVIPLQPQLGGEGVMNLTKNGAKYINNDLQKNQVNKDHVMRLSSRRLKLPESGDVFRVVTSTQFPRNQFNLEVYDEDILDNDFYPLDKGQPHTIQDKELEKSYYLDVIRHGFSLRGHWDEKYKPNSGRVKKALCRCMKVQNKEVRKMVVDTAEEEDIDISSCEIGSA